MVVVAVVVDVMVVATELRELEEGRVEATELREVDEGMAHPEAEAVASEEEAVMVDADREVEGYGAKGFISSSSACGVVLENKVEVDGATELRGVVEGIENVVERAAMRLRSTVEGGEMATKGKRVWSPGCSSSGSVSSSTGSGFMTGAGTLRWAL